MFSNDEPKRAPIGRKRREVTSPSITRYFGTSYDVPPVEKRIRQSFGDRDHGQVGEIALFRTIKTITVERVTAFRSIADRAHVSSGMHNVKGRFPGKRLS